MTAIGIIFDCGDTSTPATWIDTLYPGISTGKIFGWKSGDKVNIIYIPPS